MPDSRTKIAELLRSTAPGTDVVVKGWVRTKRGNKNVAFIAVNDVIPLTLSGDELPFHSGGVLYVPYTVFNQSSLGFYPSYNTSEKTLTLFSRSSRLVFDLAAGMVTDENKITQAVEPVIRSGVVFLPAVFCANHFGVQVSELTSRMRNITASRGTASLPYPERTKLHKKLVMQQPTEARQTILRSNFL